VYKAWWCSGFAGDAIYYSTSNSLAGGWSSPLKVFEGTQNLSHWDGQHTCDPSVLKVNDVYYMYYGGSAGPNSPFGDTNVGLATSIDGLTWTRANNGNYIVRGQGVAQ
jgi:hypothetical protein